MIRAVALLALTGCTSAAQPVADATVQTIRDDFEDRLCIGSGCPWAIAQQVNGSVALAPSPSGPGKVLIAKAGPKQGSTVAKADIVARIAPAVAGSVVSVGFDLYVPPGQPLNSIQLVDLECADCGEAGNPGVRLYLRHGRLRIDRSKIGHQHAWVNDAGPQLATGRWHRIAFNMRVAADESGEASATLDGAPAVNGTGATIMDLPRKWVDRVQIGITANSNAVPASMMFDNIDITITPPAGDA